MRYHCHLMCLFTACLVVSCATERTVYDQWGNEVKEQPVGGGESDLQARWEKHFDESFKKQTNKDGVPVSTSNKRSSYDTVRQDALRTGDKEYLTNMFKVEENNLKTVKFSEAGKHYAESGKYADINRESPYSKDLRPDFLNENHGLAHESYRDAGKRSIHEAVRSGSEGRIYATDASFYSTRDTSGYIETRRENTPQPRIISHRDYVNSEIKKTREMLGHDI